MKIKLFYHNLFLLLATKSIIVTGCHDQPIGFRDCPTDDPIDNPSYFPFPYDCKKFIICTNGVPVVECCPEGTVWNQNLEVCDHDIECVILTTQFANTTGHSTTEAVRTTAIPPNRNYCVQNNQRSREDASVWCRSAGMNLVNLDSEEDYNRNNWDPGNIYWTDGIALNGKDFILETTGQPVTNFYAIGSGEPNGTGSCIAVVESRDRAMSDVLCARTSKTFGLCQGPDSLPILCPFS